MMNCRLLCIALFLASITAIVLQATAADKSRPSTRFEPKIKAYETSDKENPPPQGAILVAGASNIVRWKSFETQAELNALLKELLMSDKNIDFIDVNSVFLANDGQPRPELFVNDGQHHNDADFKARAAIIMQHLPPKSE